MVHCTTLGCEWSFLKQREWAGSLVQCLSWMTPIPCLLWMSHHISELKQFWALTNLLIFHVFFSSALRCLSLDLQHTLPSWEVSSMPAIKLSFSIPLGKHIKCWQGLGCYRDNILFTKKRYIILRPQYLAVSIRSLRTQLMSDWIRELLLSFQTPELH